jgi:hypothetical protein
MRYNSDPIKGTGSSRLAQIIQRVGYNDYDRLEVGEVTSAPPNLRIKIGGGFELGADDVIVSECITDHTGVIVRADSTRETVTFEDGLKVGDRVIVSSMDGGQTYLILDRI